MKRFCLFVFCLLAVSVFSAENTDRRIWNFEQSANIRNQFSLRGKTSFTKEGLHIPLGNAKSPGGAVLRQKALPELNNAFSIEAEFILDSSAERKAWNMILDQKYVPMPRTEVQKKYHKGVMFFLMPRKKDVYRAGAAFGFGDSSIQIAGKDVTLKPGVPHRIRLFFSGTGKVEIYINGKKSSTHTVPAKSIVPADIPAIFGDRTGANYYPLGGTLKKLEIRKEKFIPAAFTVSPSVRRVFERGETQPSLTLELHNFLPSGMENLTVKAISAGKEFPAIPVKKIAGKTAEKMVFALDPYLLPGEYRLALTVCDEKGKTICQDAIPYTIVPSYGDFMPVILWGNYNDIPEIRKAGFTHQMVHLFPRTGNFQKSSLNKWVPHLDENLKAGLYTFGNLHANFRFIQPGRYLRKDKNGKVYPRKNLEASNPAVQKEFAEAARSTLDAIGNHPAFDGVLINSEVRDGAMPSYKTEADAFRKFANYNIPETVIGRSPLPYGANAAFPWNRVISSKQKEYVFLRWYWLTGDGWNDLQSILHKTMHESVKNISHKKRFFTFHDPATRVPPMWGSGGNVDMIGQWTYTYPDPIKIGQATDELIAMAQGKPGQKIGTMTQAIWYRSQTAPMNLKVKNVPSWMKDEAKAQFLSISPDNLREAFWSKISRRVDSIMYHGVGSLLARTDHKLYRYTNTESKKVLRELSQDVILPLGPVLKRVPEKPYKVAILQNLASCFYAPQHFPYGWSKNWGADLHLALQWGNFQPGIIYDQHLLQDQYTNSLKVLFVPGLEVVTEEVMTRLDQLRDKGVIIIGDEFTLPALMVDWRIKSVVRDIANPVGTKQALQKLGSELAALLKPYQVQDAVTSNADLVVRQRGNDNADYVFVLNDKRTFGDYIGQWEMVQEKGLPNRGTVTVHHRAAAAYDLVKHQPIQLKQNNNSCSFDVDLAPGDGRLILLLQSPITAMNVKGPNQFSAGKAFTISCSVKDSTGKNVPAILPVEIVLTADNGIRIPGSGYYAAEQGELTVTDVFPTNLPTSVKTITVTARCLASGMSTSVTLPVK